MKPIPQEVRQVHDLLLHCKSAAQLRDALIGAGAIFRGRGAHKTCYEIWGLAVKVFHGKLHWYLDNPTTGPLPARFKPYWLPYLFASRRYVVQRALDKTTDGKAALKLLPKFPGLDLHAQNVGFYFGKPVIVDYSYPVYRSPWRRVIAEVTVSRWPRQRPNR